MRHSNGASIMLCSTFLAVLTLSSQPVQAQAGTPVLKQTDRQNIVAREKFKERRSKFHYLKPRASTTPCAGEIAPDGSCCVGEIMQDNSCCPPGEPVADADGKMCCAGGSGVVLDPDNPPYQMCCFGTIWIPPNNDGFNACCVSKQITADGQTCCAVGQVAQGNACVAAPPTKAKRYLVPDGSYDRPPIDQRPGQSRTLLSAAQVAQYLSQNGIFEHDGVTFTDHHHRRANEALFRKLVGRGMTAGLRWASQSGISVADITDSIKYYPLSVNYEFAIADAPEIYARIVADPEFQEFHWKGARFDKEVLYKVVSPHPSFNESMVEQYARDFQFMGKKWRN